MAPTKGVGAGDGARLFRPLSEVSKENVREVGGKAANLGELMKSGFPVPEGYVLTTRAFELYLKENAAQKGSASGGASVTIPEAARESIRTIHGRLANEMLAVRSSGVNEDSRGSSFAGQFETVLGVRGLEELEDAVVKCWSSTFGTHARDYAERRGAANGSMGVVVQKLIRADASGVAFTVNPVTGKDEVVINAVRGLGDKLVSGRASPDEWVVGDAPVRKAVKEGALSERQALEVAYLARMCGAHFGHPVDIEWAMVGEQLFLLQARPVTAAGPEMESIEAVIPSQGYWIKDVAHWSKPVSAIFFSYKVSMVEAALTRAGEAWGLLLEKFEWKDIGGTTYTHVVPLGGERKPPPTWAMKLLVRLIPSVRSRVKAARRVFRDNLVERNTKRWYEEWKPELLKRSAVLRGRDLGEMSDDELEHHIDDVLNYVTYATEIHFNHLSVSPILPMGMLVEFCAEKLGWSEEQAFELIDGLSEKTMEPGYRIGGLVEMVRGDRGLATFLEKGGQLTLDELSSRHPGFARALQTYLDDYGCRCLTYDVIDPTLAELPGVVIDAVRNGMAPGASARPSLKSRREEAETRALAKLAGDAQGRERFGSLLKAARFAYPTLEENTFYCQNMGDALTRYALLELGRRLSRGGSISDAGDVFHLTLDEARKAHRGGGDLRETARRREARRDWAIAHPGPQSYGKPPPPPPLEVLPEEARTLAKMLIWAMGGIGLVAGKRAGGGELVGVPASSGSYSGTVRVVKEESQFGKLRRGDVLVCPTTTPTWSVVFPSVGALVTESGGTLSHPAIIAREFGIPAVLAVPDATRILQDGQKVTVDGTTGTIRTMNEQ